MHSSICNLEHHWLCAFAVFQNLECCNVRKNKYAVVLFFESVNFYFGQSTTIDIAEYVNIQILQIKKTSFLWTHASPTMQNCKSIIFKRLSSCMTSVSKLFTAQTFASGSRKRATKSTSTNYRTPISWQFRWKLGTTWRWSAKPKSWSERQLIAKSTERWILLFFFHRNNAFSEWSDTLVGQRPVPSEVPPTQYIYIYV